MEQEGLTSWDSRANIVFSDDRPYRTHWLFWAYAHGAGDLMDESNYQAIQGMMEGLDADTSVDDHDPDDWFEGTVGHWTYSSFTVFYVRPYAENGEPTPAGLLAYKISEELADYPILDEDDYSEREWKQFEEEIEEWILPEVKKASGVEFDTMLDDALWDRFENRARYLVSENAARADDISRSDIVDAGRAFAEYHRAVKDRYYSVVAAEHMITDRDAEDSCYYNLIG